MSASITKVLVSAAIGAVLGFLALRLGEVGWALAGALLAAMSVYYASRRMYLELGWMVLAAGLAPGLILARNGLTAILDPAVEVGLDTWLMLTIAIVATVVGGLLVTSAASRRRPSGMG